MEVLRFIQANFWFLLGMCGVVFVLGIVLWCIGTAMRKEGDAQLQAIRDREETEARTRLWNHLADQHGAPRPTPYTDAIYPPLAEEDYDPIEGY